MYLVYCFARFATYTLKPTTAIYVSCCLQEQVKAAFVRAKGGN
jgi:hypothetical protein